MREDHFFFIIVLILVGTIASICIPSVIKENHRHLEECKRICALEPIFIHDTLFIETDFPRTVRALIDVESKRNPSAVNKESGATGLLQLMPIYVREANRILKKNVYTLEDRFDPVKTLEMFCIIQDYHNPKQNTDKAIRLHNGGESYYRLVKSAIY